MSVEIIARDDWGARLPNGTFGGHSREIGLLVVHHSAGQSDTDTPAEAADAVRAIQRYHQDVPPRGRGWADVAYHWLIADTGACYQGRPESAQGAHVAGRNDGSIGVCLLGNFDAPDGGLDVLLGRQPEALVGLLALLCRQYSLTETDVWGHREIAATACPGSRVDMDMVRRRVGERLRSAGEPADPLEGNGLRLRHALEKLTNAQRLIAEANDLLMQVKDS